MVDLAVWMEKGAMVRVYDKIGTITKIDKTALIDGIRYVKFIYIKLEGGRFENPYFPETVKPI